jgi:hypothetical protein
MPATAYAFTCICAAAAMLASAGAAAVPLYPPAPPPYHILVDDGVAKAAIVVPREPSRIEQFAAAELQRYIARISGAELPITSEGAGQKGYRIFVGNTRALRGAKVRLDANTAGRDGFALLSNATRLIIAGRSDLGTLFGVYELLERCLGVRWFMPGEVGEVVPQAKTVRIGTVRDIVKPAFDTRWVGDGEWSLKQRMNCHISVEGEDVGVNWLWHFHTFCLLIPPEEYFDQHPDWFPLVNGKRQKSTREHSHSTQLCTSNPEVVRKLAEGMIAELDRDPSIEIITLSPNDGGGFCECENCVALDEPGRDWFARYSRRLAVLNAEVARIVGEKHPDVLIKIGAYAMYARPPLDEGWRPPENTLVQLCHIYFCHNHPVATGECREGETYQASDNFQPNQEFRRILEQWTGLTDNLYIYEYYSLGGFQRARLPWPLVHTMRHDIPFYRDTGVKGFYTQLSADSWHRLGLNYYVAAKLAWNADLDVDALLDDYFEKFYGPAADAIQAYFTALERAYTDYNGCISYGLKRAEAIAHDIFTPAVIQQLEQHLRAALAAADTALIRQRVALAEQMLTETKEALAAIKP